MKYGKLILTVILLIYSVIYISASDDIDFDGSNKENSCNLLKQGSVEINNFISILAMLTTTTASNVLSVENNRDMILLQERWINADEYLNKLKYIFLNIDKIVELHNFSDSEFRLFIQ